MKKIGTILFILFIFVGCSSSKLPKYTLDEFDQKMQYQHEWIGQIGSSHESELLSDVTSTSATYGVGNDYLTILENYANGQGSGGIVFVESFDEVLTSEKIDILITYFSDKGYTVEKDKQGFSAFENGVKESKRYCYFTNNILYIFELSEDYISILEEFNFPK